MAWTEVAAETPPEAQNAPVSEVAEIEKELSLLEIIEIKSQEYGVDRTLVYDIMWCESRLQPTARNTNTNGTEDVGYWQINDVHLDTMYNLGLDREEPLDNIEFGMILLSESSTQPWSASQHCWENLQANRI